MTRGARELAVVALLACAPALAHAHLGHEIARAERYLKLDVAGHDARVVVSLTLGEREGERLLEAADTSGDGRVDEAERDAYLALWAQGLREELPVEVDGVAREVTFGEPYLEPVGRVRRVPVTVELVAHLALEGGRQTVRVTDRMVRREVYDRTDVAFRVRDGASLVASGAEADPDARTADLAYGPDFQEGEPVILTAIVETPARATRPWHLVGLAGALAALVLFVVVIRRRRARRRNGQRRNG